MENRLFHVAGLVPTNSQESEQERGQEVPACCHCAVAQDRDIHKLSEAEGQQQAYGQVDRHTDLR